MDTVDPDDSFTEKKNALYARPSFRRTRARKTMPGRLLYSVIYDVYTPIVAVLINGNCSIIYEVYQTRTYHIVYTGRVTYNRRYHNRHSSKKSTTTLTCFI